MPSNAKPVTIDVRNNKLTVSPVRTKILLKSHGVVWHCKGGRLDILFKITSPFAAQQMQAPDDTDLPSGDPTTSSPGSYPYTIVITPKDGGLPITIDPQVDIDDPGPPPNAGSGSGGNAKRGRKKKAAKKKATRPRGPKRKR
ncbi:MAG: hypothetical protein ABI960_02805 [Candidatus Eisenbacteria bacterium]